MKNAFQFLVLFILSTLISIQLKGQCSCTDCPINTVSNGIVSSIISISNAANGVLGSNGQKLLSIYMDYNTDAINEVNVTLIAPNGSSVLLIEQTGINIFQQLVFKICFNSCEGIANPDPGFNEFFDSSGDYQPNTEYGGSYYPTNANLNTNEGCFESLTGPINGDWILQIEDEIFLDDGVLNDWFLVFADNTGTDCTSDLGCALGEVACMANSGEIENSTLFACENDPFLNFTIEPNYSGASPPDPLFYSYTSVVYERNTGELLEYTENPDLSTFEIGEYAVCGLSFLLTEEFLITAINGTNTITDLLNDITNEVFCGDITNDCKEINILNEPVPVVTGLLDVCEGELVEYSFHLIEPFTTYDFFVETGTFSFFQIVNNTLFIEFEEGLVELCGMASNECGIFQDCIEIEVVKNAPEIIINDLDTNCNNQTYSYTFSPPLQGEEFFELEILGGTLDSLIEDTAVITWDEFNGNYGEICVTRINSICPSQDTCFEIDFYDIYFPEEFSLDDTLCIGESSFAMVMENSNIIDYSWELINLDSISGNSTSTINYAANEPGISSVCLTMQSVCGFSEKICKEINVISTSPPEILIPDEMCNLEFTISSIVNPESSIQWTLIDGPGSILFSDSNNQTTEVVASVKGIYELGLEEYLNGCSISSSIIVEVFPALSIIDSAFECNNNQEYSVEIIIDGGNPPYSINNNIIQGNIYSSDFFSSNEEYSFFIEDESDCNLPLYTGSYNCQCITKAGTMMNDTITVCAEDGSFVQGISLLDSIMAQGDIGYYFLHDSSGDHLGNIIEFNQEGSFAYQDGIIPGVTYYISLVVGQAQNDSINLDNSCTVVSFGQPVIFYPKPSISWIIHDTICDFSFYVELTDADFLDSINWEFISGPAELDVIISNDTIFFLAPETNVYQYNLSLFNEWCDTTVSFTFDISAELVSVGNRVWDDYNNNGINDLDEPGIPGVSVHLWSDSDGDDIPDSLGFIGIDITDENGYYGFSGLEPGKYVTLISQFDNFGPEEPLEGYISSIVYSENVDNDIDLDNNGFGEPFTNIFSGVITLTVDGEPLNDDEIDDCLVQYDEAGNSTVDFGFYNSPMNTSFTLFNDRVKLYPNPIYDKLTIESQELIGNIKIYDIVGKNVFSFTSKEKHCEIDISYIPKGIYFIKISRLNKDQIFVKKILKE